MPECATQDGESAVRGCRKAREAFVAIMARQIYSTDWRTEGGGQTTAVATTRRALDPNKLTITHAGNGHINMPPLRSWSYRSRPYSGLGKIIRDEWKDVLQRPVAYRMPSLVVVADAAAARAGAGAGTNKPSELHASVCPFLET